MSTQNISIPDVSVQAEEELKVVLPPTSLTKEERLASLSCLISSMKQPLPTHRDVVELVYNIFQLGLPGLSTSFGSLASLKVKTITPSREHFLMWVGLEDVSGNYEALHYPPKAAAPAPEAMGITADVAVYSGMAILLFCMGRQATESSKASVMDNRPDALIRRFDITEANRVLLPGQTAGPAREALEQVYNAFANYAEVRAKVTSYFIGLQRAGKHLPLNLEVMMTNFQLMRGAGMTHVEAIIKLAQMHPWTLRVPQLRTYFEKFLSDLERFEAIDKDVRPYHRLLVAQSEYLFLSSELRPLIAVAGSFIEEVEKTFGGYVYNKAAYQTLVDEVHSRAPNYQPTSGLTKLAALLGVKEEPLPPRAKEAVTPASSTV